MRALVLAGMLLAASLGGLAAQLRGPILDGGVSVPVVDVQEIPASSPTLPLARLNVLREVPDGSGRLFVNDLNGPLRVFAAGVVETYMDFSLLFPNLKTAPGLASGFVSFAFHPSFATNGLFYTVHSEFAGELTPNLEPALPTLIVQQDILIERRSDDPSANTFSGSLRELAGRLYVTTKQDGFVRRLALGQKPEAVPALPVWGGLLLVCAVALLGARRAKLG